jgi:hypothetical protein
MRVKFADASSAIAKDADFLCGSFVFIGEDYPFAAAKAFSVYLANRRGTEVVFHEKLTSNLTEGNVHLFGSQDDSPELFLKKRFDSIRVIPMSEGTLMSKAEWGKLVATSYIVDIHTPSEKTLEGDFSQICSLMGVPYKPEIIKELAKKNIHSMASILQIVEYSANFGGLIERQNIPPIDCGGEGGYREFLDTFLYKNAMDSVSLLRKSADVLEITTRLVNDLAIYSSLLAEAESGTDTRELAKMFGQNEFFLKNKLLPRLKSLGMKRLLTFMGRITDMQERILRGDCVSPSDQMASAILVTFQ